MAFEKKSFNEVLKQRELREKAEKAQKADDHIALDDSERVKVLSPGRLVFKRFIRNRLAIVGSCILIFMFLFSFLGPIFYPYGQTERFYKYDYLQADYAGAQLRTEFTNYACGGTKMDEEVARRVNSAIVTIKTTDAEACAINVDSGIYIVSSVEDENIFLVSDSTQEDVASFKDTVTIGTLDTISGEVIYNSGVKDLGAKFYEAAAAALKEKTYAFTFNGVNYEIRNYNKVGGSIFEICDRTFDYVGGALTPDFETAVLEAVEKGENAVEFEGSVYLITEDGGTYSISLSRWNKVVMVSTTYVFNAYEKGETFSDAFKADALTAIALGEDFENNGATYSVVAGEESPEIVAEDGTPVARLSTFVVRGADGKDAFDIAFKEAVKEAVETMEQKGDKTTVLTYPLVKREVVFETDENGDPVTDENGDPIEIVVNVVDESGNLVYEDTDITIKKLVNDYDLTCPILSHLFDINNSPSSTHLFGTDSDGYDVLARMMYGGRISLMVGFVVVILETLLGTIMGGIAGYFGGWVDNLIMRLVDIFYCIPSMPILIIMGAFMDALKMDPYERLMWMMAILGFLGWASVARLVRGQILSLREQEFMVATEATGVRVRKRIFRHLVPNVMPQLIVTATAGLGGVIITESTLSFLGLGVKHPLATWGTMINSITQRNEDMIKYTYIWIPVGLLICLTVIAFNFVGDGLRDAFDPKMKK